MVSVKNMEFIAIYCWHISTYIYIYTRVKPVHIMDGSCWMVFLVCVLFRLATPAEITAGPYSVVGLRGGCVCWSSAQQSRVPATVRASKQRGVWGGVAPPALQTDCQEKLDSKCYNSKLNFMWDLACKNFEEWQNMWITSTKNLAKIHEKTFQNPGPEAPKSSSGGFWVALGRFLVTRDLPDASGTPSRRLWGGSWGRFRLILAHLGGVLGAQDGPKILPRRPKMPLRCLQDTPRSDFQQKSKAKWALRVRVAFSIRF